MNDIIKIYKKDVILSKTFNIYGNESNEWFLAREIAEYINYCKSGSGCYDVSSMIKKVNKKNKFKFKILFNGETIKTWFVNKEGLYFILTNSRKPQSKLLMSQLEESWKYKTTSSETQFGLMLSNIFYGLIEIKEQYKISSYMIDYFIPKYNLAIGYDEKHHKYQKDKDLKRQEYIENNKIFKVVRVEEGYELKGINEILKYIFMKNQASTHIENPNTQEQNESHTYITENLIIPDLNIQNEMLLI